MYTGRNRLQIIDGFVVLHRLEQYSYVILCVSVPVCRGTEICILQLVRTTALPAVSSLTTMGLSAGSFSMRSLTSYAHTHTNTKQLFLEFTERVSRQDTGKTTQVYVHTPLSLFVLTFDNQKILNMIQFLQFKTRNK